MRQNDIEKIIAYQKCFIGPLVWKCFTNNFELLLSEKEFPTFCTFFMYINVHGHQIFAKCTLNECTKMELDPPLYNFYDKALCALCKKLVTVRSVKSW